MVISMLKIRRPLGRLIFNMGIAIPGKTVFLIETAPWKLIIYLDEYCSLMMWSWFHLMRCVICIAKQNMKHIEAVSECIDASGNWVLTIYLLNLFEKTKISLHFHVSDGTGCYSTSPWKEPVADKDPFSRILNIIAVHGLALQRPGHL